MAEPGIDGRRWGLSADETSRQYFLEGAAEQLELLDRDLVRLANDPDDAILQGIFRAAHTLKGSSATIGHTRMADLTHAMESVLDGLRKGTLAITADVIDALLESLDALRVLWDEVAALQESGMDFSALVGRLYAILESGGRATATPAPAVAAPGSRAGVPDLLRTPVLAVQQVEGEALEASADEAVEAAVVEERAPEAAGLRPIWERRLIDLGPEARGRTPDEQLCIAASKMAQQAKFVRIHVARLDKLMNLTGELVIDRSRLSALADKVTVLNVDPPLTEALNDTAAHLGWVVTELQGEVMKSRMLPMEHVVNRFPRMIRDLARKAGKEVEFRITGQETELDRSAIEAIGDPLIHLLRNAVDHGIERPAERVAAGKPESGTIQLSATHEENRIVIRIRDDGRGIDPDMIRASAIKKGVLSEEAAQRLSDAEAIDLIWAPGFSTAREVTEVSGRGVGMDIVKTNIQKLNGTASVQSETGKGTEFAVRVPLTLAVIQSLVLRVGQSLLVMSISSVTETLNVSRQEIQSVGGTPAIQLRGDVLPIVDLAALLSLARRPSTPDGGEAPDNQFVVAVRVGEQQAGFIVDELLGEQEIVIKNLGSLLRQVRGISGATLLGDEVALIADVPALLHLHYERQRAA